MEHNICLRYNTSNNEAEYEALITSLQQALTLNAE